MAARRRPRVPGAAILILAAIASGRAQVPAHPPGRSSQAVPFVVGETLVYDVSWASFVTAGQATLAVRERTADRGATAWHLVADGRPTELVSRLYTLYYKVESWLDASNLLSRRSSTYSEEGARRRTKVVTFDRKGSKATYENGSARKSFTVPPLTQDPLAALYVLRAIHVVQGTRLSMPIVNNGELQRVTVTAAGRETVECGLGVVQAQRLDLTVTDARGQPFGHNLALWLTTGPRQVPVQMRADLPIGTFRLVLREARGLLP